jgi:rRNA processing protein Krr1/Pno1
VLLDDKQDYIKTCVKDDFESYYIKSRGETYRMLDKCIGLALGENLTKEDILNLREHLKLLLTEKMANPTQTQHFDQLLKDIGNKLNIENELNLFCSEKVFLKIMTLPKIKNQSWNRQGMINTMSVVKNLI